MLTRVFGWAGPSQHRDGGAIPAWQPPERCDLTLEPLGCQHATHVLWCEEQPRERSFAAANDEVFCEQAARVRGGSGAYSDTDVYWLFNRSSPCVDKWDFCARENATKCPRARAWFENHRFSLSMQRPWQCALDEESDAVWWVQRCARTCGICAEGESMFIQVYLLPVLVAPI